MFISRTAVFALVAVALVATQRPPRFESVQPELFTAGNSFVNAWADFDGDGDLDLFVGFGGAQSNRLYRNDNGMFTDAAASVGLTEARAVRAGAWGDFDRDGDPDLALGFVPGSGSVLRLYRNDLGRFIEVTTSAGISIDGGAVRQPVWIDLDADGDLDLFVAFRDRPNVFLRNTGSRFVDEAATLGLDDSRRSVGAVWFDYDEDGDLDLYVANMDGDANGLFRNDGEKFTDVAEAAGVMWGGRTPRQATAGTVRPCAVDANNDGRLDLFTANYGPNGLLLNRGGGKFEDVSAAWGLSAFDGRFDTCAFADMDHDGRADVYVNGTVTGGISYRDFLLRNTGARFEDVTPENLLAMQASHGAQWADFDRDGDVDLAITGSRAEATHALLRNMLPAVDAARSIAVRVVDPEGRALRQGATIRVYAAGTRRLLVTGLVDSGSGYDSQNDMPVHIGLAAQSPIDVEVTWAAAGKTLTSLVKAVNPREYGGRFLLVKVPD